MLRLGSGHLHQGDLIMARRVIGHDSFVYRASLYDNNPSYYGTHCVGVLYAVSEQALINVMESDKFLAKAKFTNEEIEGPIRLNVIFSVGEDRIDECVLALNMIGYYYYAFPVREEPKQTVYPNIGQTGSSGHPGNTGLFGPSVTGAYTATVSPSDIADTSGSNTWKITSSASYPDEDQMKMVAEFIKEARENLLKPEDAKLEYDDEEK
jgi:hypothetical protein